MAEVIKMIREKKRYFQVKKYFQVPRKTLFPLCQKNELSPDEAVVTTF